MNVQDERIVGLCEALQLDRVAADYGAIAQACADASATFSDFLERLLKTELETRHERARQTLLKFAALPAIKTLEDYDFGFASVAAHAIH
jgi:DNA replication protein DnaC